MKYLDSKHEELDYKVVGLEKLIQKQLKFNSTKEKCPAYPTYIKAMKELSNYIDSKQEKQQINFDMLKQTISTIGTFIDTHLYAMKTEKENLELFFEMLAKSSSFAHKAHKELKTE